MIIFWLCFVPVFVAVDAIGTLPLFLSLTSGVPREKLHFVVVQSVITAALVAVAFLIAGSQLLTWMGITVADFTVAGGLLLLILSVSDLISSGKEQKEVDHQTVGAVPIGVPLITGPALLTTSMLLRNHYGLPMTLLAVVLNIVFAGTIFWFGNPVGKFLGTAGSRILSKIANLLLASIAVMLIRKGLVELFKTATSG